MVSHPDGYIVRLSANDRSMGADQLTNSETTLNDASPLLSPP